MWRRVWWLAAGFLVPPIVGALVSGERALAVASLFVLAHEPRHLALGESPGLAECRELLLQPQLVQSHLDLLPQTRVLRQLCLDPLHHVGLRRRHRLPSAGHLRLGGLQGPLVSPDPLEHPRRDLLSLLHHAVQQQQSRERATQVEVGGSAVVVARGGFWLP